MFDTIPIRLRVDNTRGELLVYNIPDGRLLITISYDELFEFLSEQGYIWECDLMITLGVDNSMRELYVFSMMEHNLLFSVSYEELREYLNEQGLIWSEQYGF